MGALNPSIPYILVITIVPIRLHMKAINIAYIIAANIFALTHSLLPFLLDKIIVDT